MRMNQVTLPARDYQASVDFYDRLGLRLIVAAPPRYARFECDDGATLSLHVSAQMEGASGAVVYFEVDQLDELVAKLEAKGFAFISSPRDEPWLWREARLRDPSGNQICLFYGGENRRFPPWRIVNQSEEDGRSGGASHSKPSGTPADP
jgi:catechol 2,3-dioxygenase-like lactoylglutathione lyase family enzyme